jgi:hypothetical protein
VNGKCFIEIKEQHLPTDISAGFKNKTFFTALNGSIKLLKAKCGTSRQYADGR